MSWIKVACQSDYIEKSRTSYVGLWETSDRSGNDPGEFYNRRQVYVCMYVCFKCMSVYGRSACLHAERPYT